LCGFDTLGVAAASTDFARTASQTQSVERLDQPTICTTASSHVDVGFAIEQHHDRHIGEQTATFVEPQIHRHGDSAHTSDLQIQDGEIRGVIADNGSDDTTFTTVGETDIWSTESRCHFIDDPVGVGGKKNVHGRNATRSV
jgi:hypothetical protein